MSASAYLAGVATIFVLVCSLAAASLTLRRRLVGDWTGSPARLAEVVIGVSLLVLVVELLGSVGRLGRWQLVLVTLLVSFAVWFAPGRTRRAAEPSRRRSRNAFGRSACAVTVLATAFVLAPWLRHTADAFRLGMLEFDTIWYHLPFAARFAQDGWVTRPHYVGNPPDAFLPATSELFHTVGILAFGTDVLSPLLNLVWVALLLLAAWCVGRPRGIGAAAVSATLVVISLPVMAASQGGSAQSDTFALATLVAAAALVATDPGRDRVALLAGAAIGLAVGSKLTLVAPGLGLALGAVAVAPPVRRRAVAKAWTAGLLATGAFWYLRNAVYTGNPFPWLGLRVGGLAFSSTGPTIDCGNRSLAEVVTNGALLRLHIYPFLPDVVGPRWALVLTAAAAGVGAGIATRGGRMATMFAGVAFVAAVAYVFTPATAGGTAASCFAYNTRFAVPALTLALLALVLAIAQTRRVRRYGLAVGILLALLAVANSRPAAGMSLSLSIAAALAAVVFLRRFRPTRRGAAVAIAALVLAALGAGWKLQASYFDHRYAGREVSEPTAKIVASLRDVRHARIAVDGLLRHYPLYGADLSNDVEFPFVRRRKARFQEITTCREWVRRLARGKFAYVVVAPRRPSDRAKITWALAQPWAVALVRATDAAVFRVERHAAATVPRCAVRALQMRRRRSKEATSTVGPPASAGAREARPVGS